MCPSTKKINLIVYMRKKKKLLVFFLMGKINYQFIYLFLRKLKKKTTSLEKQPQYKENKFNSIYDKKKLLVYLFIFEKVKKKKLLV